MRINARTFHVQRASGEIRQMLWKMAEENDLTNIELLQILCETQQSTLKYMLRTERHPDDPDRRGDEE